MKPIPFSKMSGTGNDFIIIDNRDGAVADNGLTEFIQNVCRRRMSVGADGLILIESSNGADFQWRFFNSDGSLDVDVVDKMAIDVTAGHHYGQYDMNSDGIVNIDDRRNWVHDVANTFLGDADLNGEFDSGDLVTVFIAGKFESDEYASWSEGDWNGDMRFDTNDFVAAFQDGGFELGPRAVVNSVPEPSTSILLTIAAMILAQFRKARQR